MGTVHGAGLSCCGVGRAEGLPGEVAAPTVAQEHGDMSPRGESRLPGGSRVPCQGNSVSRSSESWPRFPGSRPVAGRCRQWRESGAASRGPQSSALGGASARPRGHPGWDSPRSRRDRHLGATTFRGQEGKCQWGPRATRPGREGGQGQAGRGPVPPGGALSTSRPPRNRGVSAPPHQPFPEPAALRRPPAP